MSKINLLKNEIRENGVLYGIKRAVNFLFSPLENSVQKSRTLLELRYNFLPRLNLFNKRPDILESLQTDLVKSVRKFWYNNLPGTFDFLGRPVTKKEIFTYGGPNPEFSCPICQKSEWLSRLGQKNLFENHLCETAKDCEFLCSRQGDELWTHLHQNFNFSIGCDKELLAPKILVIDPNYKRNFLLRHADVWMLTFKRRLALAGQVEVAAKPFGLNWSKYDVLFIVNDGQKMKFKKPSLPVIMYGHDWWPLDYRGRQWMVDWLKPDVFLSFNPGPWKKALKYPESTKMAFYPVFESSFFARPNLGEKKFDLLVAGTTANSLIYEPRLLLAKQLAQLPEKYRVEFAKATGSDNVFKEGPVERKDLRSGNTVRFLNKWSEYLGSAKFAIFAGLKYPALIHKHFELLGSGAVPIFPQTPDFEYLGLKAHEHYLPLSEVMGNNEKLMYFLDNYPKYQYIAKNAVNWYQKNSDQMMFNGFENLISDLTGHRFPKRNI